jgi:hypothetical protein
MKKKSQHQKELIQHLSYMLSATDTYADQHRLADWMIETLATYLTPERLGPLVHSLTNDIGNENHTTFHLLNVNEREYTEACLLEFKWNKLYYKRAS